MIMMLVVAVGPHDCPGFIIRSEADLQQSGVVLWPGFHLVYAA